MRPILTTTLIAALQILCVPAKGAAIRYEVTHLQSLYGEDLFFTGMSPGGVLTASGDQGLIHISDGEITTLSLPFGPSTAAYRPFNDSGVSYVDRNVRDDSGIARFEGIYTLDAQGQLSNTGYQPIGTSMTLGGQNRFGVIVGDEEGGDIGTSAGFIYSPDSGPESHEFFGGIDVTRFSEINDHGWIVGNGIGRTETGSFGGMFLWIPDQEPILIRRGSGNANGLNNLGQIIGRDGSAAFRWENGNFSLIGDVMVPDPTDPDIVRNASESSTARSLRSNGDVVGGGTYREVPGFTPPGELDFAGWLWTEEESFQFLDDLIDTSPGFEMTLGLAIAEDGSILAAGRIMGGDETQHFLLTPIPEPHTTFLLVLAGSAGLLITRRHAYSCWQFRD